MLSLNLKDLSKEFMVMLSLSFYCTIFQYFPFPEVTMDSFSRIVFCTVLLFQHTWSLGKKRFMLFFKAFPIVKFSEALNVKHLKFCVKKELVSREAFCFFLPSFFCQWFGVLK